MRPVRLRTLLVILVLVTTVPLALFAAWLVRRSSEQQAAIVSQQNVEQARAVMVAIDQEVDATIESLNVLALLEPIDGPDKTPFTQIAAKVLPLHPGWQNIRLVDTSMHVLASTAGASETTPLAHPDWAQRAVATGAPAISDAAKDAATGQWVVTVAVPVYRDQRVKYLLAVRIGAKMFREILERQKIDPGGIVTLLDASPQIIARTVNEDKYQGRSPSTEWVQRSREAPEGSGRSATLEGMTVFSAWSRSPLTGWTVGIGIPAEPVEQPLRRSFGALMTAGACMFGAGVVLALILGRDIIRAQTAAATAARALARGEPMPPFASHITEAQELGQGLREAASILETRMRERDAAQAEADQARTALLEREKTARRAAEALNRAKDEFIATVSHELRTPLNAIYGWVAMLRTGTLNADRQAHALEVIERNTRAQARLVEELLDMSRVIQGTVRLGMEPLDLSAVLDSALESLRPTAEAKHISLSATAQRGVAIVSGDPGRLQQVLWNILSNALKFTPPGGRIEAALEVEPEEAIVRISDSGEGITADFLPHVFDRFRQENEAVTRTHSGLGLGLSLVRHLVELHGGRIEAASPGKGGGSTFTIRLPLLGTGALPGSNAAPGVRELGNLEGIRGRHILIVDDDHDTREVAAEALTQAGAQTETAASAAEAMLAIARHPPDAIVADIGMPVSSGYDLAQHLRTDPRTRDLPLIALTAYGGADARDKALAAGFTAYIRKPYDPRTLASLLAALISASQDSVA